MSVLVVAKDMKQSGEMTQKQITRLSKALSKYQEKSSSPTDEVPDMNGLHKLQNLCFESAPNITISEKYNIKQFNENIRP